MSSEENKASTSSIQKGVEEENHSKPNPAIDEHQLKNLENDLKSLEEEDSDWITDSDSENDSDEDYEILIFLQLKITLRGVTPKIWRRIQVESGDSFGDLHYYIQYAMGWRFSHMHQFETKNDELIMEKTCKSFYDNLSDFAKVLDEEKVKLRDYFRREGDMVVYSYDMGDGWEHEVVLEKIILTPGPNTQFPRCVGGRRACPPEDCGGVDGYKHLLKVISDPSHQEYEHLTTWLQEFYPGFGPEKFNKKTVFKGIFLKM